MRENYIRSFLPCDMSAIESETSRKLYVLLQRTWLPQFAGSEGQLVCERELIFVCNLVSLITKRAQA